VYHIAGEELDSPQLAVPLGAAQVVSNAVDPFTLRGKAPEQKLLVGKETFNVYGPYLTDEYPVTQMRYVIPATASRGITEFRELHGAPSSLHAAS
jgi:hypothetical protein